MLREMIFSQLQTKPSLEKLFFQQKGTPSHYAFQVRDYLNNFFQNVFTELFLRKNVFKTYFWATLYIVKFFKTLEK